MKYPKGCKKSAAYLASNGCGSGWNAHLVPDNLLGLDISECCRIHDYSYFIGKTRNDRWRADQLFLKNMNELIHNDNSLILRNTRLSMAKTYYKMVREFGESAFWEGKQ